MVVYDDLTIEVALADPMIDLLRRADGIQRHDFATLLRSAARRNAAAGSAPTDVASGRAVSMSAAIAARHKDRGGACAW